MKPHYPLVFAAFLLGACSSDDDAQTPNMTSGGSGGAAGDTSGGSAGDAGSGGTTPADPCLPDAPRVAGTPDTDALADAPAQCGQAAHAWLHSNELGATVAVGDETSMPAALLSALVAAEGIQLPRALVHDVSLRSVIYKTQDRGELIDASALVAMPQFATDEEHAPLDVIMLLHGTSGFTDGCGATADDGMRAFAALFASYGYIIVAPDYIGLLAEGETGFLHPYLAGQPTAIASLDAVRAALRLAPEARGGVCGTQRFATIGASQGGHAALWVDRLAPYYARELEHVGAVATVPPADLVTESTRALQEVRNATGNILSFFGAASDWYGLRGELSEIFVPPWDVDVPNLLGSDCGTDAEAPSTLEEIFSPQVLAAATNETLGEFGNWGCMLTENDLTRTGTPRLDSAESYGILFVTGEDDNLVHTPTERKAFESLCAAGMPVRYLECAGADHVDTTFWALTEALDFIEARLAGETFERAKSCVATPATTCKGTPAE